MVCSVRTGRGASREAGTQQLILAMSVPAPLAPPLHDVLAKHQPEVKATRTGRTGRTGIAPHHLHESKRATYDHYAKAFASPSTTDA